jgi:hypothetical protein
MDYDGLTTNEKIVIWTMPLEYDWDEYGHPGEENMLKFEYSPDDHELLQIRGAILQEMPYDITAEEELTKEEYEALIKGTIHDLEVQKENPHRKYENDPNRPPLEQALKRTTRMVRKIS